MTMSLFADPTTAINNIQHVAINLVAIAGGYIIGGQFVKHFAIFLCRSITKKVPPRPVAKLIGVVGGILVAILVALLVFGNGLGIGIGSPSGDGTGTTNTGTQPLNPYKGAPSDEKSDPKAVEPVVKDKEEKPAPLTERVIVLGDNDVFNRYYRVEGRTGRMNLEELGTHLRERMLDTKRPLTGVTILVYKNSAYTAAQRLEGWATKQKLDVELPSLGEQRIPE